MAEDVSGRWARVARARVCVITDRRAAGERDLLEVMAAVLAGVPPGGAIVQVREKDLPTRTLLELSRALVGVARARACPLVINDRLDIALAVGADGVHLPERGMDIEDARRVAGDDALISVSTHSHERALEVARRGADIVLLGPVWATPSKAGMGEPLGLDALARARQGLDSAGPDSSAARARLFALGGVTSRARAAEAASAGAHGIAGIRAFLAAGDPGRAARDLWSGVGEQRGQRGW